MLKIRRRHLENAGAAYLPAGDGRFPAVLILHGSEGGNAGWSHAAATILASHGYFALPFGYGRDGGPWKAGDIVDIPIDRTAAVLAALRDDPACNGRVGVYGWSRGGEHALLLAWLTARDQPDRMPDAVAVHSPSDVVCGAFRAAYTVAYGDPAGVVWDPAERAWTWRGASDQLLPTQPIEIERYPGPVFISHGEADKTWSVAQTDRLEARLRRRGGIFEIRRHPGQDHVFDSENWNRHYEDVLRFFDRHLRAKAAE